jgi:hypothetical protein
MEKVDFNDLQPGKLYYIDLLPNNQNEHLKHIARFVKYLRSSKSKTGCFDRIKNIRKISSSFSKVAEGKGFRNENWEFYKVNKYDIIEKMENRSLNIILQNIVCDPSFTWI